MEIELFGFKIRVELIIACIILYFLIWGNVMFSCTDKDSAKNVVKESMNLVMGKVKEGLENMPKNNVTGYSQDTDFASSNANAPSTKDWFSHDLTYTKGSQPSEAVQQIMARPKQQLPLPDGQSFMFANTEFKPECCPNTYSTGSGCACMTTDQYNYLLDRGGNNVPYSEF